MRISESLGPYFVTFRAFPDSRGAWSRKKLGAWRSFGELTKPEAEWERSQSGMLELGDHGQTDNETYGEGRDSSSDLDDLVFKQQFTYIIEGLILPALALFGIAGEENVFGRPGRSQGLLYKYRCDSLIK